MDFKERYGPWAIVAGASEGTGRGFAREIARAGISCILVANSGPLEETAEEIRTESRVECVTATIDLTSADALQQIIAATGEREVGLYVANAGSDTHASRFLDADLAAWLKLMRLNVTTTVEACHYFGRLMRGRGRGGFLLVNSSACYGGSSFIAMYSSAKGFLLNFSESLWAELKPHGIDVLTLVLTNTDTPTRRKVQARLGMPMPEDSAAPDDVAKVGIAQLPFGPVCNYGRENGERDALIHSVNERVERVRLMSSAVEQIFGATSA
jgi:short-subunit dehydrogenase